MTPERYQRVGEIYLAALELPPEARSDFLTRSCGSDSELRREVESLLEAHRDAEGVLAGKIAGVVAEAAARQAAPSPVGLRLGRYRILSPLGRGGMGEVFLAEDPQLGRKVAIKLLPSAFTHDAERVRRFEREARAVSALNHPNILTIHEIGRASTPEGDLHYIVSEYIEGETLRARIDRGRLGVDPAIAIAEQVAGALSVAHAAGIVHRDIKPENVMVRPDGLTKVLDFGLAKLTELPEEKTREFHPDESGHLYSTAPGVVMGTVSYMSPEQARGQKVDHRTDIFSLGVVLYEMLAGRRPFEGPTTSDVFAALLTAEPAPLLRHCPEATPAIEQIVARCLAREREARFQSAADLLAALKSRRIEDAAPPVQTAPRAASAPVRLALAAALAALLLAGLLWFFQTQRAPVAQPEQIQSLAVLPLENLSGDPAREYFAEGRHESLIAGLAKASALRVSSRTSVMQYQQTRKPLPEIARELNVDAIIEGSVQRFGERVRISARLVRASTGESLWAETYERPLSDAPALQSEIARAVVQQIQVQLTPQERLRLTGDRPVNSAAYDDYLRGRFYANRQNRADNETAIQLLERAVAADPTFAAAHAELAQACIWRFFLFTPDEKQWEEKAFVAVEKALSLDPDSAAAHLARGRLLWTPANHFPHERAIQEYRRALALNGSLDEAQNQLALVYNHIGAFDLALRELQNAVRINPTNTSAQFRIGQTLLFQGNYEQALAAFHSVPIEGNPRAGAYRAMALLHLGRPHEAAAIAQEFLAAYPEDADGGQLTSFQAMHAAAAGKEAVAEEKIRSAIEKGRGFGHFHHTAYNIACAYALLKKNAPALQWLQSAADDGFPCYPLFERDPYLDSLRKDERFLALMANLKKQWDGYQTILSPK